MEEEEEEEITYQTCCICGESKPLTEFHRDKRSKSGRQGRCKKCISKWGKQYYHKNKEKITEYKKEYRQNNKEEIAKCGKDYYQKNKEKITKYKKEYNKVYVRPNMDALC